MSSRVITEYTYHDATGALRHPLTAAVISDLHNGPYQDMLPLLRRVDVILVPGDLLNRHRAGTDQVRGFLRDAPDCAPTFLSLGNHDWRSAEAPLLHSLIARSDAHLLDNTCHHFREDVILGGLSSAPPETRDSAIVDRLAGESGFHLLLCHHPEYYFPLIQGHGIDLTISGHAHGGQWVIGHQGIYAPGQGFLPKLTAGWYDDGHLLVSRGLTNSARIPRFRNPCEALLLEIRPSDDAHAAR